MSGTELVVGILVVNTCASGLAICMGWWVGAEVRLPGWHALPGAVPSDKRVALWTSYQIILPQSEQVVMLLATGCGVCHMYCGDGSC